MVINKKGITMPEAIIEYKDGTKERFDFFHGGIYSAHKKAEELLEEKGHLAKRIYTTDWENDIDDILK